MQPSTQSLFVPLIAFDRASGRFHKQVYDGYRAAILEGRLRAGQRVPSTRAAARELGISRLPVLNAFEQLQHEGYLESRAGSGTYVSASMIDRANGSRRNPRSGARSPTLPSPIPKAWRDAGASMPQADLGAFRVSMPALEHFPHKTWARLVSRHVRRMPIELMAYGEPAGHLPLRRAIADYLRAARAVACDASQILIVSGSQMALQLCARVLLTAGDSFGFEEPGYPGARNALGATGAVLRTVAVDWDGPMVQSMDRDKQAARAMYVTPSHQYPLGVSMNVARRLQLLDWARRHRSWIIEDDYDSEYRYASRPLPALHGMDEAARVIYIGTFSKVLFPALRVGYLVAPPSLVDSFIAHRDAFDLFSPTLYQLALADFLCDGHFGRHVRRMRAIYLGRRDVLVEAIRRRLDGILTIVNSDAGMHLTAWLPAGIDDREVVRHAAMRGINATALSSCYAGKLGRPGLVLGFGSIREEAIVPAVESLARAIEVAGGDAFSG
jgi:GntR family transcriptional regulator/MocR family aminotransferase